MKTFLLSSTLVLTAALLGGCVTYLTPGPGAPMRDVFEGSDYTLAATRRPVAAFPVRVAVVHLQAQGYRSFGASGVGEGNFSLVFVREVEKPEDFDAISSWPEVFGVVPMNRLLMPASMQTFEDLREAARSAQADVLFAYTFDTTFQIENRSFAPEREITLGVLPGREARVTSTASGLFVDARTGFVYGLAEGSGTESTSMTQWTKPSAADDTRVKAERKAFEALLGRAGDTWTRVVARYAGPDSSLLAPLPDLPVPQPPAAPAPAADPSPQLAAPGGGSPAGEHDSPNGPVTSPQAAQAPAPAAAPASGTAAGIPPGTADPVPSGAPLSAADRSAARAVSGP